MPEHDGERMFDIRDFKIEFNRSSYYDSLHRKIDRNNSYTIRPMLPATSAMTGMPTLSMLLTIRRLHSAMACWLTPTGNKWKRCPTAKTRRFPSRTWPTAWQRIGVLRSGKSPWTWIWPYLQPSRRAIRFHSTEPSATPSASRTIIGMTLQP